MKDRYSVFIFLLFIVFISLSFAETTYFDQNGNSVTKEEYEKISKKWAEPPPTKRPEVQPKPVIIPQTQPQVNLNGRQNTTARTIPTQFSEPPSFTNIDPLNLEIGQKYIVSKQIPLMPELNPTKTMEAIHNIKYLPVGCGFKVLYINKDKFNPWYKVTAFNQKTENIGSGWINSIALRGQQLKLCQ